MRSSGSHSTLLPDVDTSMHRDTVQTMHHSHVDRL